MAILTQLVGPRGAVVPIVVSLTDFLASRRRKAGLPPVPPQVGAALIDIGASRTMISPGMIAALGVESLGEIELATVGMGDQRRSGLTFLVQVALTVNGKTLAMPLTVVESRLDGLSVDALLGRDFLARCLLIYNGPSGEFTLSF